MHQYDTTPVFRTTDLCLASTLLCRGRAMCGLEKQNDNRSVFLFPHDDELSRLLNSFWANELRIEPKEFFASLKTAKTRLYQTT